MDSIQRREHGAIDMTQGSPTRLIVAFSLPLLLGNILQQMYNMVDTIVVGRFVGKTALTAVGVGFPVVFLLSSLFIGLGMGATVMIAQYIGAGDREQVSRTVNTLYSGMMLIVIPLTILGLVLTVPLLRLTRVPEVAFEDARVYCLVVFAGLIGTLGYNVNTGIMQGLGDSRTPLAFLGVACALNVILDLVFVLVFHWNVFGVAFATVLAQICSWIFGVIYINRKYSFLQIRALHFKVDKNLLRQLIRLGVPSGIQQCQFSVAIILMQALINGFGSDFAAGFTAANKIDSFAFMPIQSFAVAVTTYVGQNMGAGRLDRVQKGARSALILSVSVCAVISAIVLPLQRPLLMLFNQDSAVIAAGEVYLIRVLSPMFILAALFTLNSVLRGAGETVVPMVSSIVALWGARVPAAYLLAWCFPDQPGQLYWSYLIGWVIGMAITVTVYVRGRWKEKCLIARSAE